MFGMMFGQDAVTSKFYTINLNQQTEQWVELNSFTGYSQSWYIVDVIDENVGCRLQMDGGVFNTNDNHRHDGNADFMMVNNFATSTESIYIIDSNPRLRITNNDNCAGEIYASITSNFPPDTSGDVDGDGYDDVCYDAGADSVEEGDMNGDGAYDVLDVVALVNCVLSATCG
jgi:hypothetical protein